MWVEGWTSPEQWFEWQLESARPHAVIVTILVAAASGSRIFEERPHNVVSIVISSGNDYWGENW